MKRYIKSSENVHADIDPQNVRLDSVRRCKSVKNLLKYAEEGNRDEVREEALENPNFPADQIDKFYRDKSKWIRRIVAYKTSDPDILNKLLKDTYFEVRIWGMLNPMATIEQIQYIADNDKDEYVRTRAQQELDKRQGVKRPKPKKPTNRNNTRWNGIMPVDVIMDEIDVDKAEAKKFSQWLYENEYDSGFKTINDMLHAFDLADLYEKMQSNN